MKIVTFLLTAISDLLMHNPENMSSTGGIDTFNAKSIPTPEEEAAQSRYVTEDGFLWFPAEGPRKALINGSKGRRIGKQAAASVLKGTVFNAEERLLLLDIKTKKPLPADRYDIYKKRVSLKTRGGVVSVLRSRARIKDWCGYLPLELDDMLAAELVEEIYALGGRTIGIGDYRPEKSGPFGRFKAELVNGHSKKK